jgi:hypothetical protein
MFKRPDRTYYNSDLFARSPSEQMREADLPGPCLQGFLNGEHQAGLRLTPQHLCQIVVIVRLRTSLFNVTSWL